MRILLVEDDGPLRDLTAAGLRRHGFAVDTSADGHDALDRASYVDYCVVVLERDLPIIHLPIIHGDDLCTELHEMAHTPRVLMLTAFGEVSDRIDGLDLGASVPAGRV